MNQKFGKQNFENVYHIYNIPHNNNIRATKEAKKRLFLTSLMQPSNNKHKQTISLFQNKYTHFLLAIFIHKLFSNVPHKSYIYKLQHVQVSDGLHEKASMTSMTPIRNLCDKTTFDAKEYN